jgi:hypothetical protein
MLDAWAKAAKPAEWMIYHRAGSGSKGRRTLGDGRRVFVRSCEVGDAARGGVVKDYRIVGETAA